MRPFRCFGTVFFLAFTLFYAAAQKAVSRDAPSSGVHASSSSLARLPLLFETNTGQASASDLYLAHAGGMLAGFSSRSLSLTMPSKTGNRPLTMQLVGAREDATLAPFQQSAATANYLVGNTPSAWRTHVAQYARLTANGVYPGVDLTWYGNNGSLEHDFIVQPGADYRQIHMRYQGARSLTLEREGDLHVQLEDGEILVHAPRIYQTVNGVQQPRVGHFVLAENNQVSFDVDSFDPALPLVIDPVLDYATYLANLSLYVYSTAVDAAGNTYIAGLTFSSAYPVTQNAVQKTCDGCTTNYPDVFITKLNATGTAQVYSTYLGGSNYDQPSRIIVDANGNAIVTGYTNSTDFPLKNPISSGVAGSYDGFITSLSPDGSALNFSSRLGGTSAQGTSASTFPGALAVDAAGDVFVSGTTESSYLPVTSGALHAGTPSYSSGNYVFLTKLLPAGGLSYSAIVGATGSASFCCSVAGLAVDASGSAYLGGTVGVTTFTSTTPWPITSGAYQSTMIAPGQTAPFAAKVSADGSQLLYSTLVTTGVASSMALTSDLQVILVGSPGTNYPVTSGAYSSHVGTSFLARLSADGSALSYSSYFSTPTADTGGTINNVALDSTGNVWIAGNTQYNNNLPLINPLQSVPASSIGTGSSSSFVSEFDPLIQHLLFSTYFNGVQGGTRIAGLAIDMQGRAHIAGTGSYDLPTTPSVYLASVTPPPINYTYNYGFAALLDASVPGPGICFGGGAIATAVVGTSAQTSVNITNCGNASLNISGIQISSTLFSLASATACVGSLAPAAFCTVPVTFSPAVAGNYSTALTVSSNATISSYNVNVSGVGTAPSLSLFPSSVAFPNQVLSVGASGASSSLVVTNAGTAPLTVYPAQATITGDFSIVSNTCNSPIRITSPLQSYGCTFALAFNPSALGLRTGTLTIASNDPVHPATTVTLSGTAIAAYSAPTLTSLSTASVPLGSAAFSLQVNGTNFFPTSYVVVAGEALPTTYVTATGLQVTLDASLLTVVGELPVSVVNPAPGGQSNSVPLLVYRGLPVSAASLVYNTATQMLYASIPSAASSNPNTVLPINPQTGSLGTPIPVGNNPGKLAVSSDGAYLFVGLNADHTLERINLATAQVDRTFPLPLDSLTSATTIYDMHGLPGLPQSVVVSLSRNASPSEAGAALFNDAGLVSFIGNTFQTRNYGIDSFALTLNASILYAYPVAGNFFSTTAISASALTPQTQGLGCCNQTTGSLVASDGSLLYTNSGQVWNPATATLVGTYAASSGLLFYEPSVLPDTANKRTFLLDDYTGYAGSAGYTDILSFDQTAFTQAGVAAVALPNYNSVADLNRWGADGFAFRAYTGSSSDQVILLRSSLTHTATGGTPTLLTLFPAAASVGSSTSQITVSGSGFLPGSTLLWNGATLATSYISATQLSALIPSSDFASAGTAQVTVNNPAGGSSAALLFAIGGNVPGLAFSAVPNHTFGDAPFPVSALSASAGAMSYSVISGPATLSGTTVTLTGAGTVVLQATQVAAGSYTAATATTSFQVGRLIPALTGVPSSASITYGAALGSISTPGSGSITGSFTYLVMPAAGAALPATASTVLPAGSDNVLLTFTPADSTDYAPASASVTLTVNKAPLTLQAANATRVYGVANPTFTAQLTGAVNGDGLSASAGSSATTASNAGTYSVVPAVTGSALPNYTVTGINGTLTVTQAASTSQLTSSPPTVTSGQSLLLTAAVSSSTSGSPTGTVQFLNGSTLLGTVSVSSGSASLTVSGLSAGTANLSTVYSGDTNFTSSTSTLNITVASPILSVASSASALSIKQGASGSVIVTVSATGSLNQRVNLTCSGLPYGAACGFSPASFTLASAPVTTTLTITTTAPVANTAVPALPGSKRNGSILSLACLIACGALWRNRRVVARTLLLMLLCLAIGSTLSGCGGSGASTPSMSSGGTPLGASMVTITVSAPGTASQTIPLTLTVQ